MLHRVKKAHDVNEGKWVCVGGHLEENESPEDCVCREVLEETGVDVSKADGGYCFCYHRENKGQNYIVDIYRFESRYGAVDDIETERLIEVGDGNEGSGSRAC